MRKADGRIIGWGGLYDDPFAPGWGAEVGCFFHPTAWGQGYATELVTACLDMADNTLRLPDVIAFAHPENLASRHILEKTGFELARFIPGTGRYLYKRSRPGKRRTVSGAR